MGWPKRFCSIKNTLSKILVQIAYVSEIGCFLICLGLPNWVRLFLVSPNRNISPAVMLHKIQRHNFFPFQCNGLVDRLTLLIVISGMEYRSIALVQEYDALFQAGGGRSSDILRQRSSLWDGLL